MFNLRIAFLATSVCWLAFALADSDASSGTNTSSTLNCERGTYDDAEGNCKQCKDFFDSCKSDEECCAKELLQCYQGVCGCKLETLWSQFDKECLATPTFPPEIEGQIKTTILVASIVGGIFVLIVLLLIIYVIVRAYKIYKLEQARRASGQDVRSAAFHPSAHPPPPPPGTVVWNNDPAHNQQQHYQQPYPYHPHAKAHVTPPHSLFPRRSSTGSASAPPEEVCYDYQPSQSQDTAFSPPSYPSYESAAATE
ncbi:Hypothetical predicted protein [Cloeon dipterum]|uniref:Uncharacterized protein n=1 Tax=Cloeon dipterum TaxID=197152 RepID=A0A8S1DPM9_9INSE|nr:Hypothetical predicted protein [Cloeon dipterum]